MTSSVTSAASNYEAILGKKINLSLAVNQLQQGPHAEGVEGMQLTGLQKVGDVMKSIFNTFDSGFAATSRGMLDLTSQLFGKSFTEAARKSDDAIYLGRDCDEIRCDEFVNGKGEAVDSRGKLAASLDLASKVEGPLLPFDTIDGEYTVTADELRQVVNQQGQPVDINGEVIKDRHCYDVLGTAIKAILVAPVALLVRITGVALAAIAAVVGTVLGLTVLAPIISLGAAIKGKWDNHVAAKLAENQARSMQSKRERKDLLVTIIAGTHATDDKASVLRSLALVNSLVPVRLDASGAPVTTGLEIDEDAAATARFLLNARLYAIADEEANSLFGKTKKLVSGAATAVANGASGAASAVANGVSSVATSTKTGIGSSLSAVGEYLAASYS